MFKSKMTWALASLGVAGLAATQSANAAIALTSPGPSELLLAVVDTVSGSTYYKDLGVSAGSGTAVPNIASFTSTLNDANWTAFTAAAGSNPLQYAVVGGASVASPSAATPNNFVTTTGSFVPTAPTKGNVATWKQLDTFVSVPLNGTDTNNAINSTFFVNATDVNNVLPTWSSAGMQTWKGAGPLNLQDVGSNSFFYDVIAGNGFGASTIALIGSFNLSGNTLTYTSGTGGPAVPLPAAVWLLGSGLMGLAGVGRRRQKAA